MGFIAYERNGTRGLAVADQAGRHWGLDVGATFSRLESALTGGREGDLAAAARRQIPLSVLQLDEPDMKGVYGQDELRVRSDHHIAWRGTGSRAPNADMNLATALGWGAVR
jgi:hypothetical protein